jgi:hypothetical protein
MVLPGLLVEFLTHHTPSAFLWNPQIIATSNAPNVLPEMQLPGEQKGL